MGRLGPFSLPAGPYEITLRRARCVTEFRHVRVTGKRRVEVAVKPGWLPGSLLVRHPAPAEVWRKGARLGETGAVITNLPAGETAIQVRRPGFRSHTATAVIPPAGQAELDTPELIPESAVVRISAGLLPVYAGASPPNRARVRINGQSWQEVALPFTAALQNMAATHELALETDHYEIPPPQRVKLVDKQVLDVVFRLKPKPVRVRFDSAVEADVYLDAPGEGFDPLRKLNPFRRDKPAGRTGQELELEAIMSHRLVIRAPGYLPLELNRSYNSPGKSYPPERVKLNRSPKASRRPPSRSKSGLITDSDGEPRTRHAIP